MFLRASGSMQPKPPGNQVPMGPIRLKLGLATLAGFAAALAFASIVSATASQNQHPLAPPPALTETPPPLGLSLDPGDILQAPPAAQPQPDLIVSSVSADRTHYLIGMTWSLSFQVQNIGELGLDEFQATWSICRFALPTNWMLSCSPAQMIGGTSGVSLAPGEAAQLSTGPFPFDGTPADDPPFYPSALNGIPDSGPVFLTIDVVPLSGGVEAPQLEHNLANNRAMAVVVYPSGPANPGYNPSEDQDGDGWSAAEGDCRDDDPEVYPWHGEVEMNGLDDDCSGGDTGDVPNCPPIWYPLEHLEVDECLEPPGHTSGAEVPIGSEPIPFGNSDADGDGFTPYEGDCNDANSAFHPAAAEIEDASDNDCDGLIDEGFLTPDWVLAEFELWRGYGRPATGGAPIDAPYGWLVPVLRYGVEVENRGESLTDCTGRNCMSQEGEIVEPWVLIQDLEATIMEYGSRGHFHFQEFNYGAGFQPACHAFGLIATLPGGLHREWVINNNTAVANVEDLGGIDRDLFFDGDPNLTVDDPSTVDPSIHVATSGECPALPQLYSGLGILDPNATIPYQYDLFVNGVRVAGSDGLRHETYEVPPIQLPASLSRGDIVCLRTAIDPHNWLLEADENNNLAVQIYEYRNPIFGAPRLEPLEGQIGPPVPSCAVAYLSTGSSSTIGGALLAWGPLIGLSLGLGLLGGVGGGVLGRSRDLSGAARILVALSGAVVAGGVGGVIGTLISAAPPEPAPAVLSSDPAAFQEVSGLGSCDTYLDPGSSSPPDAAVFEPNDASLVLLLGPAPDAPDPLPDRFLIEVLDPANQPIYLTWDRHPESNGLGPIPIGRALQNAGRDYRPAPGAYRWSVRVGQVASPDGEGEFLTLCRGSSPHSFTLLSEPTPLASETPIPSPSTTATQTITPSPTVTATLTPVPDTSGPKVGGIGDNPDPIFTSGNKPDVSTISATVNDPAGVASVTLYYAPSGGKYQVWGNMQSSGDTYSIAFGPFASAATYEYRILAVDLFGNANCSVDNLAACPGGSVTVTIP